MYVGRFIKCNSLIYSVYFYLVVKIYIGIGFNNLFVVCNIVKFYVLNTDKFN